MSAASSSKLVLRHALAVAIILPAFSVPVQACDSCAAAVQLPINTGLQVAQITATTLAVVSAIGLNGGGNGGDQQAQNAGIYDAAKSAGDMINAGAAVSDQADANFRSLTNAQSVNCRLHTKNLVTPLVENIRKQVGMRYERGLIDDVYFNNNLSRERIAAGHLYRLCQNGQLRPADFGPEWFATNNCIDDPQSVHDFLKISTILDNPVLIPVSAPAGFGPPGTSQMDVLNNPESFTPAQVNAVWNGGLGLPGLNDKQKKYVGAVRYCENLVLSKIEPQKIRNSGALTLTNMRSISQNNAAMGSIASVAKACQHELGRHTALDPDDPAFPPGPARQALIDNREKIVNFLVNMRGADVRALYAFATPADYNAIPPNPIQVGGVPKAWISQYVIDRYPRDFGMSIKCSGYADTGTDAGRTGSMLACNMMAVQWELSEATRRKAFIEAVAAIDQAPGFSSGDSAAIRTKGDHGTPEAPLLRDASLEIPGFDQHPMRLEELLNTMNAVASPARSADAAANAGVVEKAGQ